MRSNEGNCREMFASIDNFIMFHPISYHRYDTHTCFRKIFNPCAWDCCARTLKQRHFSSTKHRMGLFSQRRRWSSTIAEDSVCVHPAFYSYSVGEQCPEATAGCRRHRAVASEGVLPLCKEPLESTAILQCLTPLSRASLVIA